MKQTSVQINELGGSNKKLHETLIDENKKLQDELDRVKTEKLQLEKDLGQKHLTIQILTESALSMKSEILSLKEELRRREDVEKQLA
mmetsp:Transcript_29553/g.28749  ORF Transcript_29553/g.28749 Transcript_29553/m.28749 type:complete len:87 (-) Transcript_29553:638-898(-)